MHTAESDPGDGEFVLIATGNTISMEMSSSHLSPAHIQQASITSSPAHNVYGSSPIHVEPVLDTANSLPSPQQLVISV